MSIRYSPGERESQRRISLPTILFSQLVLATLFSFHYVLVEQTYDAGRAIAVRRKNASNLPLRQIAGQSLQHASTRKCFTQNVRFSHLQQL